MATTSHPTAAKTSEGAASSPVIEMEGVDAGSMRDLNTIVAENVDWTIGAGDYWVIGGQQGSGKSDFLAMTGGLMPPLKGSYRLFGQQMPIFDEARLKDRLRMGLVFETGQLFNHLTVRENISLPWRYHRNLSPAAAAPRVDEMLEALELAPWADSTPGAIARNWQKRVALGRALILEPELLLLDNPVAGLDLLHLNWWLEFLGGLSRGHGLLGGRKATLLVTATDLRPWRTRARQFAILHGKRLALLGPWARVEAAGSQLLQGLLTLEKNQTGSGMDGVTGG